jgi:hypothetical protein
MVNCDNNNGNLQDYWLKINCYFSCHQSGTIIYLLANPSPVAMTAKDLFTIILKVFGIYLIKDVLFGIPPILDFFFRGFKLSPDVAVFSLIISFFVLGLRLAIVYLLLFKTSYLISQLKLTSDLSEKPLVVNMHRSSVYTIAIIVTGLIILTFSIPALVKHVYRWYEYVVSKQRVLGGYDYDYTGMFTSIAEVIVGLLFLGNQQTLVNFIESRRREAKRD